MNASLLDRQIARQERAHRLFKSAHRAQGMAVAHTVALALPITNTNLSLSEAMCTSNRHRAIADRLNGVAYAKETAAVRLMTGGSL